MNSTPSRAGSEAGGTPFEAGTFGSLFAGVGGFDLGLERAGWKCAFQVEADPFPRGILARHYPNVPRFEDVRDVDPGQLVRPELLVGGFPCTDLSVAGKGAGLAGEKSRLFWEFMRFADALAPRWLLIENVPGLLSSHGGRDMATLTGALGERGYWWTYRVLDTQFFGPPQRRNRVFVVGHLGAPCPPEVLLEPTSLPWDPTPEREARPGSPGAAEGGAAGDGGGWPRDVSDTLNASYGEKHGLEDQNALQGGGMFVPADPLPFDTTQVTSWANYSRPKPGDPCHPLAKEAHPPAIAFNIYPTRGQGADLEARETDAAALSGRTMETERGTRIVTPRRVRRLTPRECERLHGFPDDWTRWAGDGSENADTPRYRALGNAVSPPVAAWIGRRILKYSDTDG